MSLKRHARPDESRDFHSIIPAVPFLVEEPLARVQ